MKRLFLTLVVTSICGTSTARADSITFDELVRVALTSSPEAAKIDATLAERAAEAFSTKVKDNPVLSAGIDLPINRPKDEERELSLTLSQAIRPSDFGERAALATLINETAETDKILALNEFILNVALLYARAWQFQETETLLSDARAQAQQVLKKVSEGAGRGLFPEGDVALFKAGLKTFEAEGIAAKSELARAKAELTRLSGVSVSSKTFAKPSDVPPVTREELERLTRNSKLPVQQRYELLKRLSEKQLEVARLDSFPAVSPGIGYGRHDDGTSQVMVGISVPLPIFNRNEAEQIRAHGALAAAKRGQTYSTSEGIVSEVLLLHDALLRTKEQVDLYETGVLPANKKAVDAYFRQFDAGIGTAFQLWQTQRELNQSRLRSLELQSALAGTKAQLNALIGLQQF